MQPHREEAVVDGEGQRRRDDAPAGHPPVDPVPGVGRAQRTPGDPADGELPDEGAVEQVTANGSIRPALASREKLRTICPNVGGGAAAASGWVASHGVSQAMFAERTAPPRRGVRPAQRAQLDVTLAQHDGPRPVRRRRRALS